VSLNGTLGNGTYDVVITATDSLANRDTNSGNDTISVVTTISAPFVDLTLDAANTNLSGNVVGGSAGRTTVTLHNLGNVSSTGYTVEVFATDGGAIPGGATPIGTLTSPNAKIGPGGTLSVPVSITVPAAASNHAYTLVARVTLGNDIDHGNDTLAAGTLTATPTPPVFGNLPAQITFDETQLQVVGPQSTELGTISFAGQTGNADGFHYTIIDTSFTSKTATFQLDINPLGNLWFTMTFFGTHAGKLDGKTIIFQSSKSGAAGKIVVDTGSVASGLNVGDTAYFRLV
jgi:hypothetical protein